MDFIKKLDLSEDKKKYLLDLVRKLEKVMEPDLFAHSVNTMEFAVKMALPHIKEIDLFELCVSSAVHDYGKIFDTDELTRLARVHSPGLSEFELSLKPLLHSFVGDFLISRDFGIKDQKILRSVKYHTIGSCDMSVEEKILFIADKVEKGRKYEKVEKLRSLALENLNLCLIEVYKNTIIYVINKNSFLHPDTSRIWNNICGGN
jgi:predicted HD superfamily hydrolase involved in NAD metabolism